MSERKFSFEDNMDVAEKTAVKEPKPGDSKQIENAQNYTNEKFENDKQHINGNQDEHKTPFVGSETTLNDATSTQTTIVKKNTGWVVAFLIALVCAGIAIATLWATLSDVQSSYDKLQNDYSRMKTAKESAETAKENAEIEQARFSTQVSNLLSDKLALQRKVNEMSTGLYDAIYSFDPGKYYSDFHASTDILVIKKGKKKTLEVYLNHYDTTLEWEWTDGSICDTDYGNWNDNMSIPIYITAKKVGTTVFTFKNSYNSETFNVLVVVVE